MPMLSRKLLFLILQVSKQSVICALSNCLPLFSFVLLMTPVVLVYFVKHRDLLAHYAQELLFTPSSEEHYLPRASVAVLTPVSTPLTPTSSLNPLPPPRYGYLVFLLTSLMLSL